MRILPDFKELKEKLNKSSEVVLLSHSNPDGDAVGSLLALALVLDQFGKNVVPVVPNRFPAFLNWLPGSERIMIFDREARKVKKFLTSADLIFCLDFNDLERTGSMKDLMYKTPATKVLIDHHPQPADHFEYVFSNDGFSSTGELLLEFMDRLFPDFELSRDLASCLYTAIMTDTGSFSFGCNRPETYHSLARLVATGIDAEYIHRQVYDTFSEDRLRLLGYAINNKMEVWPKLHTAIIWLNKEELARHRFKIGDTEGVVNYPLSMKKVNLSVLITEKKDLIRLSFRSKGSFSVNDFARAHFNGGGHHSAAGGNSSESLDNTLKRLKEMVELYKNQLDYLYE